MKTRDGFCPNCFETKYGNGECQKCGYREDNDKYSSIAIKPGTILKNRYIMGRILGKGGFGITYKAYDIEQGKICAIKEYAPSDGENQDSMVDKGSRKYNWGLQKFIEEANILQRLKGLPEVVDIYECFQENNRVYFSMEFLDGVNLNRVIHNTASRTDVRWVTSIIYQVALAIGKIHKNEKKYHGDISPENIFITKEGKVKIIDFGSVGDFKGESTEKEESVLLKLKFSPPELYSSRMPRGSYTDVYALAATYYYALSGQAVPTAAERMKGMKYTALKQMGIGIPDRVSDLADRSMELDYRNRTQTMEEFAGGIRDILKIPSRPVPYIEMDVGKMKGRRWQIPLDQQVSVGRSEKDNLVAIPDNHEISRVHCLITYCSRKNLFIIRDVSRNGTLVSGRLLENQKDYEIQPFTTVLLVTGECRIKLGVMSGESD